MGIPSYYKKLVEADPDLLQTAAPQVDWLFMDYNCLIYHCLHSPTLSAFSPSMSQDERAAWEEELIREVVAYTLQVIQMVRPTNGVYLAIDGVVPMAKMRQQRLRRFKSAWLAEKGWNERPVSWDTNAITPGTAFMDRLRDGLLKMIRSQRKQKKWHLSASDEPGEGEHKILSQWRTGQYSGRMAVYGMDADLILLTMLCAERVKEITEVWLFREAEMATKAEATKAEATKAADAETKASETYEWFSIAELRRILCTMGETGGDPIKESAWIQTYGCAMSLLGNDFLPRSLSLTLREDGHAELISQLRSLHAPLLRLEDQSLCAEGWIELFGCLAGLEEQRIHDTIKRKRRLAQTAESATLEMGQRNWPLSRYDEEYMMMMSYPPYDLRGDWKDVYAKAFFPGWGARDVPEICREYVSGLQWIWSYYMTDKDAVCYNWYYPHSLPPLWTWLAAMKGSEVEEAWKVRRETAVIRATDIRPVEQLALVLPVSSWSLIPSEEVRSFPLRAPYYFPTEFELDSVGKRFFWECEPKIPIPSIFELKQILTS